MPRDSLPTPPASPSSLPAPGPRTRANAALFALAVGGFTIGTTEFTAMGILTNVADGLGVTVAGAGWMITAYALGVVVGAPLITVSAARIDRKVLLIALMVVYGVGNTLSATATSLVMLCILRFITGLGHGVFFGVGAVVGTRVVGRERRGHAVATMMVGLTVANIVGVPLASAIGDALGWQATFVMLGVLSIVTVAALLFLVPAVPVAEGVSVRTEVRALRNGSLWVGMLAGAVGFGGLFAAYSYVKPIITDEAGMPATSVPYILGLFGVAMTVGTILGGRLVDRSVRVAVWTGLIATAVSVALFALTMSTVAGVLISLFALGASSQALGVAMQSMLMDLSPQAPSLGASLCHSALNLGNANGAFLGGLVLDAGLGYPAVGWLGVGLTLAGMAVIVPAMRAHRGVVQSKVAAAVSGEGTGQ